MWGSTKWTNGNRNLILAKKKNGSKEGSITFRQSQEKVRGRGLSGRGEPRLRDIANSFRDQRQKKTEEGNPSTPGVKERVLKEDSKLRNVPGEGENRGKC